MTEGSKISGRFDTGDTIDTIALNKMLQQDPTITQIAANWNESPLINYEIKAKEDQWSKILKLNLEKLEN